MTQIDDQNPCRRCPAGPRRLQLRRQAGRHRRSAGGKGTPARALMPARWRRWTSRRDRAERPEQPAGQAQRVLRFRQLQRSSPDYQGMLSEHAEYLAANKGRRILIQGNTDERGTSEYNLALGQKRAEAVRRSTVLAGACRKARWKPSAWARKSPRQPAMTKPRGRKTAARTSRTNLRIANS
ncbi:OmpA family protein [Cupriavidus basilensis]